MRAFLLLVVACWFAARTVMAQPSPRLVVPSAHLPGDRRVDLEATISHVGHGSGRLTVGLSSVAAIEVELDRESRGCNNCLDEDDTPDEADQATLVFPRVAFLLGLAEGRYYAHQPALALRVRVTPVARHFRDAELKKSDATLLMSKRIGAVRLTAGATWFAARHAREGLRPDQRSAIVPAAALAYAPRWLKKSWVLADITRAPQWHDAAVTTPWLVSWGTRFRVTPRIAADFFVTHRIDERIDETMVQARVAVRLGSYHE